ncbi:MAG TPA: decarboxylase [Candidatus Nanoarchaeia archaeon]|nr:decarboxylase [Candidatus Nanoarchaeia archaeon]
MVPTPKFIISKKKVLEQYNKIRKLCDTVSYSSKTNPFITEILEENTDSMFSLHMASELKHIKDNSRVLFLAQGFNHQDIKELTARGINWFVVDNEHDLNNLLDFLKKNNISINLLLRLKLKENTIKTEKYFAFGMNSETVNKKIRELRSNKNIKNLGIHFHRKTQNMSEWDLKYEFENAIDKDILPMIDIVNIGGGLPSDYANTNMNVLDNIFIKLEEFWSFLNKNNIKMMIEPGRFIAAPAGKLATKIILIYENNIIVNASVYHGDLDALIVPVKLKVEGEVDQSKGRPYVVKGVTPCSMDIFRYRVYLPDTKVAVGKELVFLNAGAYNFSTDFCDLYPLKTEIVDDFN